MVVILTPIVLMVVGIPGKTYTKKCYFFGPPGLMPDQVVSTSPMIRSSTRDFPGRRMVTGMGVFFKNGGSGWE